MCNIKLLTQKYSDKRKYKMSKNWYEFKQQIVNLYQLGRMCLIGSWV